MVLRKKVQKVPVGLKQESYRANKKDSKGSHITEHPDLKSNQPNVYRYRYQSQTGLIILYIIEVYRLFQS